MTFLFLPYVNSGNLKCCGISFSAKGAFKHPCKLLNNDFKPI